MRMFAIFIATLLLPSSAYAHAGHLGELAGHSHWIALGAGVAAAALAAWLGKEKMKADSEEEAEEIEDDGETSDDASGAQA